MRKLICFLLALTLLCTPAAALDLSSLQEQLKNNDVFQDLMESEAVQELFDNEEVKAKVEELLENMDDFKAQIKTMTDAELEQKIREAAAEYNIPEMNQEQIDFLIDVCRNLDTLENIGSTVEEYGEKVNNFGQTLKNLSETLSGLLDKLTGILDGLNELLGKFSSSEA